MIVNLMEDDSPLSVNEIYDRFSMKDLIKPKLGQESLAALLFYFGMITLAGRDQYGRLLDARTALQAYRQTLHARYGAILKLRVYAVVSLALNGSSDKKWCNKG